MPPLTYERDEATTGIYAESGTEMMYLCCRCRRDGNMGYFIRYVCAVRTVVPRDPPSMVADHGTIHLFDFTIDR